jgi:hypothetical protein
MRWAVIILLFRIEPITSNRLHQICVKRKSFWALMALSRPALQFAEKGFYFIGNP